MPNSKKNKNKAPDFYLDLGFTLLSCGLKGENFPKKLRCAEESSVITTIPPLSGYILASGFLRDFKQGKRYKKLPALSDIPESLLNRLIKIFKYASRDRFDSLLDSGVPAYGHGQAMDYPDLPFLRWSYEYDYSDEFREGYRSTEIIENSERYRRAFSKLKEYLLDYLNRHLECRDNELSFKDFTVLFDTLTSQGTDKGRIRRWTETMVEARLFHEGYVRSRAFRDLLMNR